jgi:hypothetical protein
MIKTLEIEAVLSTPKKTRSSSNHSAGRKISLTPTRKRKKSVFVNPASNESSQSPYKSSSSKVSRIPSYSLGKPPVKENMYSWNCKTAENKFTHIRPCVVIKPDLVDSSQLFGLFDGEAKELIAEISAEFQRRVDEMAQREILSRRSLRQAYVESLNTLKKGGLPITPHEICMALIKKNSLKIFNIGTCGVLIGRKTRKGWESSLMQEPREILLDDSDKILIICNSGLLKGSQISQIMKIAGNYWQMKNPNIACWEINEMTENKAKSLCLVIYIYP